MNRNPATEKTIGATSWTREVAVGITGDAAASASPGRILSKWIARRMLRFLMRLYFLAMKIASWAGKGISRPVRDDAVVLLTATFYSDNWLSSHLRPLAESGRCQQVLMVAAKPVPPMRKVEPIYPPAWLTRIAGGVPSRLLMFLWVGARRRPDVVGGFHLLVNGLAASLLGRAIGARSLYFCGGGATEVLGGGHLTENRLFRRLETPDAVIERRLIEAVGTFDHVIAMGSSTVRFFRDRGVGTDFRIVPGGKDGRLFRPSGDPPSYDLITVGRLSAVKRLDIFLKAVRLLVRRFPEIRATIVGDGPLRGPLEELADSLGIENHVSFVGHQTDVENWLRRGRIFVLTSDSEGLSLALMEAMMCGLAAVVSDVGDLADLVENGVNGFLVNGRTPEGFAGPISELLGDPPKLSRFREAALGATEKFELGNAARAWDEILMPSAQLNR